MHSPSRACEPIPYPDDRANQSDGVPATTLHSIVHDGNAPASGLRNTPTDEKGSVAAQASLRPSHSNTNPIRISKGSSQRNAHRAQLFPNASTVTKTASPELCSQKKWVVILSMCLTMFHSIRSYSIEIVQHPVKQAEFGDTTLTRLPLAPPLIARLVVTGVSEAEVIE